MQSALLCCNSSESSYGIIQDSETDSGLDGDNSYKDNYLIKEIMDSAISIIRKKKQAEKMNIVENARDEKIDKMSKEIGELTNLLKEMSKSMKGAN